MARASSRSSAGLGAAVVATISVGVLLSSAAAAGRDQAALDEPMIYRTDPAWSRDGRHIAFVDTTAAGDLWVMNADGSGLRKLTDSRPPPASQNYGARQPAWSPDGKTIAFGYGYEGISLIGVDGTGLRPFVRDYSFAPEWSPGGRWIAYAAGGELNGTSISVKSPDGSKRRLVARRPCCEISYNGPTWSPDGERIAFTVGPAPDTDYTDTYLGAVDRFRGPVTRLTRSRYPVTPDWSPDGRKIVFSDWSRNPAEPQIVVLTLRTAATRAIGKGWAPSWSPDGRRIAFSRGGRIWVMRADGSQSRPLTPRGS